MAPDGDWGSAPSDDYDAVVAELRVLADGGSDDLEALAAIVASLQAAAPVTDRSDWALPDLVREAIWGRVDAHIDAMTDDDSGE